ncbi:hypothetical protein VCUG_01492 [Vavraia culicis subsp. floridensis]|uniref:T-complex protein 1, theta subunit n=1 Tax=Vavraia culicis (isolate floridensis) TaxID=948595 RepID=L2GUL3_VAVCU|nr:uncharacterized protein VCUG_01492 [Vavraia culicis subsp. floridensis]ELA47047.1 hypothetical protein VCUG_01492 [Vavraia culicis subsp. floridensis]
MDFSNTGLQSILNNSIQHKNVKLIMTVSKAEELIDIVATTFRADPHRKIIVDSYNNLIITSETTKILSSIKLVHPIQFLFKDILLKMSKLGDGNTFLILFVGKLLRECKDLLVKGMKAHRIVATLKNIKEELFKIMDELKEKQGIDFSDEELLKRTLMPILKNEILATLLSKSVVESGFVNPDDIRIQKVQTGCLDDSFIVHGMFLEKVLQGTVRKSGGKIAIFNTSLDIERTETKGTLLFEKAEDMLRFSKDEEKRMECLVDSICEGVNAVICNGNVNEQYAEFFNNNDVMVIKVNSKFDIRRIMRMSRGSLLQTIRKPRREETGEIDSITTVYDENKTYLQLEKKDSNIVSIVLKDSLASNLDESELLLEKGIKILESLRGNDCYFVDGAGRFELQLSDRLAELSANIRDSSKLVYSAVIKALSYFYPSENADNEQLKDIYSVKRRTLEYAIDLACEVLMIEDYLVAKNEGPVANN